MPGVLGSWACKSTELLLRDLKGRLLSLAGLISGHKGRTRIPALGPAFGNPYWGTIGSTFGLIMGTT